MCVGNQTILLFHFIIYKLPPKTNMRDMPVSPSRDYNMTNRTSTLAVKTMENL